MGRPHGSAATLPWGRLSMETGGFANATPGGRLEWGEYDGITGRGPGNGEAFVIEKISKESLQYVQMSVDEALAELSDAERTIVEDINRRIAAAESVEALVDFLFEATRDVCPCDRISLAFVEEDGRRLVSHHTRTSYEPVRLKKGFRRTCRTVRWPRSSTGERRGSSTTWRRTCRSIPAAGRRSCCFGRACGRR